MYEIELAGTPRLRLLVYDVLCPVHGQRMNLVDALLSAEEPDIPQGEAVFDCRQCDQLWVYVPFPCSGILRFWESRLPDEFVYA